MANYSGLWNNEFGQPYARLSSTAHVGNGHTALSRVVAQRTYGRAHLRGLLKSLVGGAVGEPAIESHKRVAAERDLEANVQGGKRTIETFSEINRVTTQADADRLVASFNLSPKPTYPKDKSGNGGGSRLGW